jgi:hypothetical protein
LVLDEMNALKIALQHATDAAERELITAELSALQTVLDHA